jgi:hypothetical protein
MSSYNEFKNDISGFIIGAGLIVLLALSFQVFLLFGVLLLYPLLLGLTQAYKGRKLDYIEKDVLKIHTVGIITLGVMIAFLYYFISAM